jgi:chemotaxis protein methyltransferase CheR
MANSAVKHSSSNSSESDLITHVSEIVQKIAGIQLGEKQKAMVQARIGKRMLDLGLKTPEEYMEHLHSHKESEGAALVSLLTTHHTFFFREFSHFEFLERAGLAQVVAHAKARGDKKISVWSAASSRGQEAYSLSMFLAYHLKKIDPAMDYEIFGSDVDPESVKIAKNGVYRWEEIKEVPAIYVSNHFSRGTGEIAAFVKAKESIKSKCSFDVLNLFDLSKVRGRKFDIIFCRNVFIYFTHDQIKTISNELLKNLQSGGYLFTGMSETLNGLNVPVKYIGPSIYCHAAATDQAVLPLKGTEKSVRVQAPIASVIAEPAQKVRVLCVDDSATILTLLKKVLTSEAGFEVVGTAKSGLEASEFLKKTKVDVVTLDIHMPEQNGIEYLEQNYSASHPPVVMISSASREDSALGMRSLELGAADYIEKPTLANLADKADEIKTKIRCALKMDPRVPKRSLELDQSFKKSAGGSFTSRHLRVFVFGIGDKDRVKEVLRQCTGAQPTTLFLVHGPSSVLPKVIDILKPASPVPMKVLGESPEELQAGSFYIGEFESVFAVLKKIASGKNLSTLLFASAGKDVLSKVQTLPEPGLILEDIGHESNNEPIYKSIRGKAKHFVPYTSFTYHSDDDLFKGKK